MQMIKVLLADDHQIFREGVKSVLEAAGDLVVTGEASSGEEALEKADALSPDVVVLDLSMPGKGGLETTRELKRRNRRLRVLILTVHPEDHHAIRCFAHGADGYMVKDVAPQQLVAAIRILHGGGKYIAPCLVERLLGALGAPDRAAMMPHAALSRRELEVARLISSGLTPGQIASRLGRSATTIRTQRASILRKMRMRTTAELMRYALEHQLGFARS
ncbi:MAG TPA: response regulator transcription factor [Thermoanaerobaculia bacterium]|nr:response regulator transcription factor [Thermoanaerobaculia bacterium]